VRKAANCIDAAPLARPTPEVMQELQRLHPQEAPPPIPHVEDAPIVLTEEHLSATLHKTGKGKTGGRSGWTYEHVRAIVQEGPAAMSSVLRLVNVLVTPPLLDGRLFAARKRGGGIRPIAIQEVWLRFAGLCVLEARGTDVLAPLQLCSSTRCAHGTPSLHKGPAMSFWRVRCI
jgi:hypothetical protein